MTVLVIVGAAVASILALCSAWRSSPRAAAGLLLFWGVVIIVGWVIGWAVSAPGGGRVSLTGSGETADVLVADREGKGDLE